MRSISAEIICPDGFTLLEILIAMLIFGVTLTTLYMTYTGTLRNMQETESVTETYQKARVALERIIEDLESVYLLQATTDTQTEAGFYGKNQEIDGRSADNLVFNSTAHIAFDDETQGIGRARLNYYVTESEDDKGFILFRTDTLEFDNTFTVGEGGLVLCNRLHSLDFTYYDEKGNPYDEWDSTSDEQKGQLPSRISVSLEFSGEDDEPSRKFQTDVAIPLKIKSDE